MPEEDAQKLLYHNPGRMKPDIAKMSDEEIAAAFRARETLALLTWEPWMHYPKLRHRLYRIAASTLFASRRERWCRVSGLFRRLFPTAAQCAHADDQGRRPCAVAKDRQSHVTQARTANGAIVLTSAAIDKAGCLSNQLLRCSCKDSSPLSGVTNPNQELITQITTLAEGFGYFAVYRHLRKIAVSPM
jgi:hypothetical protein